MVAKGVIRRTGARGISIRATAAWALDELYQGWVSEQRNKSDQKTLSKLI